MTAKNRKIKWRHGPVESAPPDYVIFTMTGRFTQADIIRKIAERLKIGLDPLPKWLSEFTYDYPKDKGRVFDGSAGAYMDWITAKHENMWWSFSDGTLRVRIGAKILSKFDEAAGRLWPDAPRKNGPVSDAQLAEIAKELDREGFKLKEHLEPKYGRLLGAWNQRNPRRPIQTFCHAVEKTSLKVAIDAEASPPVMRGFSPRYAVRRALSRAAQNWRKIHAER